MPASAAVGFAAAMSIAFFTLRPAAPGPMLFAGEVVSSHVRSLMAGYTTDVRSSDRHTVKPWFAGKIDFSPTVKDLAPDGFELEGGRLDYIDGKTVAAIVFRRRGHVVNLFVWPQPASSDSGNVPLPVNGFNIVEWNSRGLAYWAVSGLNAQELANFARRYQE
jgi:anti-sigma factor RsiW